MLPAGSNHPACLQTRIPLSRQRPAARWSVDQLDQRAPSLVEWLLWAQGLVSLAMHIVTTGVNLGVIWVRGQYCH